MTFTIGQDHLLSSVPKGWEFEVRRDKVAGVRIKPLIGVVHYGVTQKHDELVTALLVLRASAHLAVTARGGVRRITQMVPFNVQAGHAGETAVWNARRGVNGFSVGIEINNPGPLTLGDDGVFLDAHKRPWEGEVLSSRHARPGFPWRHWARYTDDEIAAVTAIMLALKERYGIVDVVGHDEIRKDKSDPGPAFPMEQVRALVFPKEAA
jgi:N-acetylmuramoyl-L-alanine amidase